MFDSRFYKVVLSVTAAALAAMVIFQIIEMNHYELFDSLKENFF